MGEITEEVGRIADSEDDVGRGLSGVRHRADNGEAGPYLRDREALERPGDSLAESIPISTKQR